MGSIIEQTKGITESSKQFFIKHRNQLGTISHVSVLHMRDETRTTVIGSENSIELWGLNIGYSGEGPRGLSWLLEQLGIKFNPDRVFTKMGLPWIANVTNFCNS